VDFLVFANSKDPAKERFFQAVAQVPRLSPKFVLEQEQFMALLMNGPHHWRAIVFFVFEADDLSLALSLKPYLSLTRVIMVLPDWDANRVKLGLSLGPSLMTKANGDFSDVVAVLAKISTLEPQEGAPRHGDKRQKIQELQGNAENEV
jgi:hypothetical protein